MFGCSLYIFVCNYFQGQATGEIRFFPKAGFRQPGSFVIRASRARYDTSFFGNVKMRMTMKDRDINEIEKIVNQAYPCLTTGNFRPFHAFVITYACMLYDRDERKVIHVQYI